MATITLKNTIASDSVGELPSLGSIAPGFTLTAGDLSEKGLEDFLGKRKLLNIVPSLDTDVCAASARRFNEAAASMKNCVVLVISADLPFAQKRFCSVEGLENVVPLSTFRSSFGDDFGTKIIMGPLAGLQSRAVLVLDENNRVLYREQVPDISREPDYPKALAALS